MHYARLVSEELLAELGDSGGNSHSVTTRGGVTFKLLDNCAEAIVPSLLVSWIMRRHIPRAHDAEEFGVCNVSRRVLVGVSGKSGREGGQRRSVKSARHPGQREQETDADTHQ